MAVHTRTTRLADTIAALIVLMVSSFGSALALAAQDLDVSMFARQVRSLLAENVAGSSETPEEATGSHPMLRSHPGGGNTANP